MFHMSRTRSKPSLHGSSSLLLRLVFYYRHFWACLVWFYVSTNGFLPFYCMWVEEFAEGTRHKRIYLDKQGVSAGKLTKKDRPQTRLVALHCTNYLTDPLSATLCR